jgi:hypothetical protein
MRVFDGTGKIWADTFADGRLLYMPPASAALLILFNRNHNVSELTLCYCRMLNALCDSSSATNY